MAGDTENILVDESLLDKVAQTWEAESPKVRAMGDLVRQMTFKGGATETNLFPNSIGRYGAVVSAADAACQEGTAIMAAIGATLRVALLVYRHADADALAAATNLRKQVEALGGLP
jgi:hypothetical protein